MSYVLPQRQLVSQDEGSLIEKARVPRSKFINTWTRKTAFNPGALIPLLVDEILPGDHMTYDVTAFIRTATILFPMFDSQRIDTHFFFVPNRLVWDNWARFMGEQDNPGDSIAFTIPQVNTGSGGDPVGSIWDHFGLPVLGQVHAGSYGYVNALPFRCYNLIYNTWFRDENLSGSLPVAKDNGPDNSLNYGLAVRNKSHDYFTSLLPWPQKFTAPTVAVGGLAPIQGLGVSAATNLAGGPFSAFTTQGTASFANVNDYNTTFQYIRTTAGGLPSIYADLSAATGVQINVLRQAWMVQQLLERDARGGTRYTELIRSHFGVINPDYRLQRPEYIGGGSTPLSVTPVAQTAPAGSGALGALGAAGTAAGSHHASYAATEHGYIIGLISVKSDLSYQQGLHRMWTRQTRYDFYWPSLAGLGEQAVMRSEIWQDFYTADTVFGYQERWQEYRTKYSDVTGIMRSTAAGTLDAWHLAQKFTTPPVLGTAFLGDQPPMQRVLAGGALTDGQQYLANILYRRTAVRPIPTYGTPVALGRF